MNSEYKRFIESKSKMCESIDSFSPELYEKYDVKKGLRDSKGSGVVVGLTSISQVDGTEMVDGVKVPCEGKLRYRGYDIQDLTRGFLNKRFGFEECAYLLLFGDLPDEAELEEFRKHLSEERRLPVTFTRDVVMKAANKDIMNSVSRCILFLASYDKKALNNSTENVLRQCIYLISVFPMLTVYSYHAYNHYINDESMYIHRPDPDLSTAENILRMLRPDKSYTYLEATVLDLALVLHMEHGGGNNSTFTTRVTTSSGSDTYAVIAAAMSSLKGPKHGGANLKVMDMMDDIKRHVKHTDSEKEMKRYLTEILDKKVFDHQGLIYGMGHAVYTKSDPRALVFKSFVEKLAVEKGRLDDYRIYETVERLAPELILAKRPHATSVTANVDFYSGFVYDMLGIPKELYTPLFATARIVGWSAHRIEEIITSNKILRPAYVNIIEPKDYIPLEKRRSRVRQSEQESDHQRRQGPGLPRPELPGDRREPCAERHGRRPAHRHGDHVRRGEHDPEHLLLPDVRRPLGIQQGAGPRAERAQQHDQQRRVLHVAGRGQDLLQDRPELLRPGAFGEDHSAPHRRGVQDRGHQRREAEGPGAQRGHQEGPDVLLMPGGIPMENREERANGMFACSDRERALFEAGIKMGTLYHQFVGMPVSASSVSGLERTMADAIRVQPYVEDAVVRIDRGAIPKEGDEYSYTSLTGDMIDAVITVRVGESEVVAEIRYDGDLAYPLMYVSKVV